MPFDPFCGDEVYEEAFLETEHFLAVPNLHPVLPGHVLVVPKRHVAEVTELSGEEMADLRVILGRLLPKLLKAYDTDSYNLAINKGEVAGMSIAHMHIHIVPRHDSDAFQKKELDAFYEGVNKSGAPASNRFKEDIVMLRKLFRYAPAMR